MVYNCAHGIPASTAGQFPVAGNYTTRGTLNLSTRTINQRLRVVIRFYQWAEREGLIDSLPFDYAQVQTGRDAGFLDHVDERGGRASTPAVLLSEEAREIRYLAKEQIAVCHESLTNQTHQLLLGLMVRTGLRQMEARSFPDAYIFDPDRRRDLTPGQRIRVVLHPRTMEIKLGKPRGIDVPYDLMQKLWVYTARSRQARANNRPQGEEFAQLFSPKGASPSPRTPSPASSAACPAAWASRWSPTCCGTPMPRTSSGA